MQQITVLVLVKVILCATVRTNIHLQYSLILFARYKAYLVLVHVDIENRKKDVSVIWEKSSEISLNTLDYTCTVVAELSEEVFYTVLQ
jgi:hypothetical protein